MTEPTLSANQDPLVVLRATPAVLEKTVLMHTAETLRIRPFKGKWTPCEILGHLMDHEIVTACRLRTTRFSPRAWIDRYPQESWVEIQRHNDGDPVRFVEHMSHLRGMNIEQYASLTDEEWSRPRPRTVGSGDISLERLVHRHANHDLHHLEQLERYLKAIEESRR